MLQFLPDENFDHAILRGRLPLATSCVCRMSDSAVRRPETAGVGNAA